MAIWDPPIEISIALYPDCAMMSVHGLTDMFNVASNFAREMIGPNAPMLRVSHWRANAAGNAPECVFDTHPDLAHKPRIAIVPGSFKGEPDEAIKQKLVTWLLERHTGGSTLCSVCGGAFILAQTGLLSGRTATTHWDYTRSLAERFPDIAVDEN